MFCHFCQMALEHGQVYCDRCGAKVGDRLTAKNPLVCRRCKDETMIYAYDDVLTTGKKEGMFCPRCGRECFVLFLMGSLPPEWEEEEI